MEVVETEVALALVEEDRIPGADCGEMTCGRGIGSLRVVTGAGGLFLAICLKGLALLASSLVMVWRLTERMKLQR
jgi:hypothetical protein